jgi:hypothetical protein
MIYAPTGHKNPVGMSGSTFITGLAGMKYAIEKHNFR